FAAGTIGFVVTNGTPSPDGIGNLFPRFISATGPSLNNAGEAASRALFFGTGVGSTNDTGIFRGSAGNLTLIVREGQRAPDGTDRFDDFLSPVVPALNDAGQVAFGATLYGPDIGTTN